MAVKKLCREQLTTSVATYISGTNELKQITAATVTNTGASPADLDVYVVDSGGSSADANAHIIKAKTISAGATIGLSELIGQSIDKAETLQAQSSAATSLTLFISGNVPAG